MVRKSAAGNDLKSGITNFKVHDDGTQEEESARPIAEGFSRTG